MNKKSYMIGFAFMLSFILGVDCSYCKNPINENELGWTFDNGASLHHSCLICSHCKVSINPIEDLYSLFDNGASLHHSCFICPHCNNPIEEEYTEFPNNTFYHSICEDGTTNTVCSSCLEKRGFIDGRHDLMYCQECHNQIVQKEDIEKHSEYALDLLEKNGFRGLREADISIEIVDEIRMSSLANKEGFLIDLIANLLGMEDIKADGLCSADFKAGYFKRLFTGNKEKRYNIYMIENQPIIDFRATLAHEYLHAWMMVHDIFDYYGELGLFEINEDFSYSTQFIEGFAQIGSYLVFEDLNAHIKISDELDNYNDMDYGEGYRMVNLCLDYHGLDSLTYKVLNKERLTCFEQPLLFLNKSK